VALLALAAAAWLIWRSYVLQRRRRPLRHARRLYAEIYQRYQRGEIGTREYLQQSNELIKRVLIHGLGEHQARRATGRAWLELLDRHVEEPAFSRGPGQLLGDVRFRPQLDADAAALHPLLERLLARLTPLGDPR
jgi:hypothetical protein